MKPDQPTPLAGKPSLSDYFESGPAPSTDQVEGLKQEELDTWENEGGEVPAVPIPHKDDGNLRPRKPFTF